MIAQHESYIVQIVCFDSIARLFQIRVLRNDEKKNQVHTQENTQAKPNNCEKTYVYTRQNILFTNASGKSPSSSLFFLLLFLSRLTVAQVVFLRIHAPEITYIRKYTHACELASLAYFSCWIFRQEACWLRFFFLPLFRSLEISSFFSSFSLYIILLIDQLFHFFLLVRKLLK